MKKFGETLAGCLSTMLCGAIFIWFIITAIGNIYGVLSGKGLMQTQIKEKEKQIVELQKEIDTMKNSNQESIKEEEIICSIYVKVMQEYYSIESYNRIIEKSTQPNIDVDELMEVEYEKYSQKVVKDLSNIFDKTEDQIKSIIENQID